MNGRWVIYKVFVSSIQKLNRESKTSGRVYNSSNTENRGYKVRRESPKECEEGWNEGA